jgi:hypothetical protein
MFGGLLAKLASCKTHRMKLVEPEVPKSGQKAKLMMVA